MNTKSTSKIFLSHALADTVKLGRSLGRRLKAGDVVLLVGTLGAGKTSFVQGVVRGLGVKDEALSPTFILAQTLNGKIPVHHLDFYRVTPKELLEIGLEDYLTGAGQIEKGAVLIEWADRFKKIWPADHLLVTIKMNPKDKSRSFHFQGVGTRSADLVKKL